MNKQGIRIRNWSDYNKALVNRGSITFWMTDDAVKQWRHKEKQKPGGIKLYSDLAIQVSLTIKTVYKLAYRQTQGFIDSLFQSLGQFHLKSPHYTQLCRRAKTVKIQLTTQAKHSANVCVLIDSTGIKVFRESEWYASKHGKRLRQKWKKLHISIDHHSQFILSAKLTDAYVHDASHFPALLTRLPDDVQPNEIIADGAYSLYRCHLAAQHKKAKLIAPPHRNSRKQSENRNYRDQPVAPMRDAHIDFVRHYANHESGLKEWKQTFNYHRRSLVETAMFRLKTNFGRSITAKDPQTQENIMLIRCAALNKMTSLGMPAY